MPSTTLLQLLTDSLEDISAVVAGQTVSAEDSSKAHQQFLKLLGWLSAEGLMVPAVTVENFALTIGAVSRTIGTAGNFNTARPEKILHAYIRDSGGIDYPMTPMGAEEYASISDKDVSERPTKYWYNPTYPLGTIYFNFAPDAAENIYLVSEKPLSEITSLTTAITLPNEYLLMLQSNLALLLCNPYEKQPSPLLVELARATKNTIMRKNLRSKIEPMTLKDFPGVNLSVGTIFNYYE